MFCLCNDDLYCAISATESVQYDKQDQAPAKQARQQVCLVLDLEKKDKVAHGKVDEILEEVLL